MRTSILVGVVATLLAFSQIASALYTPGRTKVDISLTKDNFASTVLDSDSVWLIEFYATWCGHCKNFAPVYEKVAENLEGMVKVAAIDVDQQKELAGLFGVQSMPTIKLVKPKTTVSAAGKFSPEPEAYNGQRSAASLVQFALAALNDYIETVDSKKFDSFLAQKRPKIVLFTNKPKASDLYRALASEFRSRAAFGIAQSTDAALVAKFGITKFPTIVAVNDADPAASTAYTGAFKAPLLAEWLGKHTLPPRAKAQQQQQKQQEKPKVEEMKPVLNELTSADTLKTLCVEKGGLCAIAFIDTFEDSKADYLAKFEKVVKKQYKNFRFFWTNQHQSALRDALGVPEMLPGLAVYNPTKARSIVFRSAFAEDKISEFLESILSGSVRKTLPVSSLPEWQQPPKDEL